MRDKAIEDGTSVEDYLESVISAKEQERQQQGAAFIAGRTAETAPAANIGAGSAGDLDGQSGKDASDKLAKEIADMANGMTVTADGMY